MTRMVDPMRAERVTLRDGRTVTIRPSRMGDAESLMRNANLVGAEEVYILVDHIEDMDAERRWLAGFDGVHNILFVADAAGEVVGSADCDGGNFPKTQHVGGVGIAIRDGWREIGLGRILMNRILEWMHVRGFKKAELCVFASNMRARRLYESLGFLEEGIRRRRVRIRDAYEDEVFMGLWLGE